MRAREGWATGLTLAAGLVVLAGCGIKGDPIPPDSSSDAAANQDVFGPQADDGAEAASDLYRSPEVVENENLVEGTEIRRNPQAERKSFFLDPLLN